MKSLLIFFAARNMRPMRSYDYIRMSYVKIESDPIYRMESDPIYPLAKLSVQANVAAIAS
jgi:hypothetical protein